MKNKVKLKSNKIKSTIIGGMSIILFTLTIPALSLIKIQDENVNSFSIRFDMTSNNINQSDIISNDIDLNIEETLLLPTGITLTDYENNNFYLIQNYKTGEVLTLTPTEYIKGVVAAEMPITFHDEALKAQAVTAHSYALRQIENSINTNNQLNGAYLSNDPSKFQACFFEDERKEYWGDNFDEYENKLDNLVKEVITKIAVFDNQPIIGAFHSMSNGQTETAQEVWGQAVSYLVSTTSIGDQYSPNYETQSNLTSDEVRTLLLKTYPNIMLDNDITTWFSNINTNESGRVSNILVGNIEMTGHELRTILKLRSASFDISITDNEFIFTQTGYGHGVGLSQYGADYMARQGFTYDAILKHYYSGVNIIDIIDIV